jgi:hypothetical protein
MDSDLKLFVWEGDGVLTDYTNGLIVALAHDLEEAQRLFYDKCDWGGTPPIERLRVVEWPEAFYVWGGG